MKITRTNETDFTVETSSGRIDTLCRVIGHELLSFEQKGDVLINGLIRVSPGPKSYSRITSMQVGEEVVL